MTIALLHYTSPPVVGGVETVILQQARFLSQEGKKTVIISGKGEQFDKEIPVIIFPELSLENKPLQELQDQIINSGKVDHEKYDALSRTIQEKLEQVILEYDIEVIVVHNIMTMHFHFPLVSAIHTLTERLENVRFFFWCHDGILLRNGFEHLSTSFPWSELKRANPRVTYVTITEYRRDQFSDLLSINKDILQIVPNGMESPYDEFIEKLMRKIGVDWDDFIIVSPVRIVQRKNLEFAIKIFAEIKKKIPNAKYIIPGNVERRGKSEDPYFKFLQDLIQSLDIDDSVLFIYPYISLKRRFSKTDIEKWSIFDMYAFTDLVLLTSTEEGFGLPVLEAAVRRIPVAASNIPPFMEIVQDNALIFDLANAPQAVANRIMTFCSTHKGINLYDHVMKQYQWPRIIREKILPLLFPNEY
ncbi:MAG: glycosyltransferase family 4 protein [Candidatus Heimdallarchaeota archaeon]